MKEVNDNGFSLLELVVAVGILLVLTVGGLLAYNGITKNARMAAVQSAADEVLTGAVAADVQGKLPAEIEAVGEEWNNSGKGVITTTVYALKSCIVVEAVHEEHDDIKTIRGTGNGCEYDENGDLIIPTGDGSGNPGGENTPPIVGGEGDNGGNTNPGDGNNTGDADNGGEGDNGGEDNNEVLNPSDMYVEAVDFGDIYALSLNWEFCSLSEDVSCPHSPLPNGTQIRLPLSVVEQSREDNPYFDGMVGNYSEYIDGNQYVFEFSDSGMYDNYYAWFALVPLTFDPESAPSDLTIEIVAPAGHELVNGKSRMIIDYNLPVWEEVQNSNGPGVRVVGNIR